MRRLVIFDYDSLFSKNIERVVRRYNLLFPERAFSIEMYNAKECSFESVVGSADVIIHSGGDGRPVKEDITGIPKLYICHSHQWKAMVGGGRVVRLKRLIKAVQYIDILENSEILGKKGKIPIMQYHALAVTETPPCAEVLATSKAIDKKGEELEIIEALRYPDGSMSIQGHPEEGTAAHIFYNFFEETEGCNAKNRYDIASMA